MISELVWWNNPANPVQGYPAASLTWPGACLSANCLMVHGQELLPTDVTVRAARWLVTWEPNTTSSDPETGVYLVWGDDGPSNVALVASILSGSLDPSRWMAPNPSAVDVTLFMNMLLSLREEKLLGIQTLGNGRCGPLVYGAKLEITWNI